MKVTLHPRAPAALRLPSAPKSIRKGVPLKHVLGPEAVDCLAHNLGVAFAEFNATSFRADALDGLETLGILERGRKLADALWRHLPHDFSAATSILLRSLTPPLDRSGDAGLSVFFYLPHVCFVAAYGLDPVHNGGGDPFDAAMTAQYELTQRFSAEFSIRPFIMRAPERTLARLLEWTSDASPHVRRLCSEGTRPRLPWAARIPAFIADPSPVLPILEALKDDDELYVRRSVANHLGDIAKDHPELAYAVCERWLRHPSPARNWLVRHALRHPAKKGDRTALRIRAAARP